MRNNRRINITNAVPGVICIVVWLIVHHFDKNRFMMLVVSSDTLSDALTGILTFSTLILGFIGVLLPTIMGMKKESDLVERFFNRVPQNVFSRIIRNNILAGLALAVCTILMYFAKEVESISASIAINLGWGTAFFLLYFTVTTFRVLNLLIRLLVEDSDQEAYPDG